MSKLLTGNVCMNPISIYLLDHRFQPWSWRFFSLSYSNTHLKLLISQLVDSDVLEKGNQYNVQDRELSETRGGNLLIRQRD